jgi:hydroxymethylglutaryl-CoA synthase
LIEKYSIRLEDIGRLEVGTESLVDKSKSTKTVLMSLFEGSGNNDIEGATVINACYGGTAALLNALAWVDSSGWDGRYAIVVAADIAVYADGPARPTGGCGAVAMLVGRDAPIAIDLRSRVTHATNCWDFFKPNMESEYPEVNGALSQTCYLRALDDCYTRFAAKQKSLYAHDISCNSTDYFIFHSPYNKLVQKSFSRLLFQDMINGRADGSEVSKWINSPLEDTYEDKELEAKLKGLSKTIYEEKVAPSCVLSKLIGNTYTASVYMNLANLVSDQGANLDRKKICLFSYGSGALASMLSITPRHSHSSDEKFSLSNIQKVLDIPNRLASRVKQDVPVLNRALEAREKSHGFIPFQPTFSTDSLFPGTFYLKEITAQYERIYERKVDNGSLINGSSSFDSDVAFADDVALSIEDDTPSLISKGSNSILNKFTKSVSISLLDSSGNSTEKVLSRPSLVRNKTVVWASGRPNVNVVVTGIAAALPGRNKNVFEAGFTYLTFIRIFHLKALYY